MMTMAANARLADAGKVADAYSELMQAQRGELDAVVTSAAPLTKAQEKKVSDAVSFVLNHLAKYPLFSDEMTNCQK